MTIPIIIEGVSGRRLELTGEGAIPVVQHNHPFVGESSESYPISLKFENSGSNDMRVDGSTTPVEFSINASEDKHIFINCISVIIADASAVLNKFGNLTALTNGIDFVYSTSKVGEIIIRDEIKSNLDFIRLGITTGAVGGGTTAWKSDLSGGGADAYMPTIDISDMFGFIHGLHLRKGTVDRVFFRINDNLSAGLDQFDAIAYGKQV